MDYLVIDQEHQKTSSWAGGKTTEIFIYPTDGNYAQRDFSWRVSSATVELDESDFTPLYGVKRWIMPFDAPLLLKHKSQQKMLYEILLKPYETHCFKGDWDTKSIGKTRDFNLMLKEGSYGILKNYKLQADNEMNIRQVFPEIFDDRLILSDKQYSLGIYNIMGSFSANCLGNDVEVCANELLVINNDDGNIRAFESVKLNQTKTDALNLVIFFVAYDN